jgi:hypothetical protein
MIPSNSTEAVHEFQVVLRITIIISTILSLLYIMCACVEYTFNTQCFLFRTRPLPLWKRLTADYVYSFAENTHRFGIINVKAIQNMW